VSTARQIALAPEPCARVVSLEEWRAAHRSQIEFAPPMLRLVGESDSQPQFRLEVFLRRARAVMAEPHGQHGYVHSYTDAEPA
jgi:hypothetical protein